MEGCEPRKSVRPQTQMGRGRKGKKTDLMLAASFSGTPLLEERERSTGLLRSPYLLHKMHRIHGRAFALTLSPNPPFTCLSSPSILLSSFAYPPPIT